MVDFVDEFFRSLASSTTPYSHSKTRIAPQPLAQPLPVIAALSVSQNHPRTVRERKRGRKRDFTIFVDAMEYVPLQPAAQRPRKDGRAPLMVRNDSANSTPAPSPRLPTTPTPLSPTDPLWIDRENWDPNPLMTPPPTPAAFPHDPTAVTGPPPPSPQVARVIRPRRASALPPPQNMVLYDLLGLSDWRVSPRDVRSAFRHTALTVHPDQAAEEDQEAATLRMQQVTAARDVLLNDTRRRQYHEDGELPWAL